MGDFIGSIKRALAGQESDKDRVRRLLVAAQRSHATVEVFPTVVDTEQGVPVASIEQVRAQDMIISQPLIGGKTQPLAANETLRIRVQSGDGWLSGQTRSLGRIKLPSGGDRVFYGYRLAFPPQLEADSGSSTMRDAG